MTRESSLKRAILARLRREPRWRGFSVAASGTSVNGLPDIVGCWLLPWLDESYGRFVAIECKTHRGQLTKLQAFRLEEFRAVGALVVVARSVSDVEGALGL